MPDKYRFDTIEQILTIEGKEIRLTTVLNPELLFDQLVEKGSSHSDVLHERIPYWAELWPASKSMSSFLLQNPELVNGKTILEIGCGLGLAGIAAKLAGGKVTMTDYLPEALELAKLNWKANTDDAADIRILDWNSHVENESFDVLIGSDVLYDKANHIPISRFIGQILKPGGIAIFSDPKRSATADFIKLPTICEYKTEKFEVVSDESVKSPVTDVYLLHK